MVTAASTATLSLAWNAASDNVGVSGYRVFANGVEVGTTASTSYAVITPAAATTYTVSAYDAAGNESGTGGQAAITWPGYDSTAPTWSVASPTLRVVTQSSNKWTLAWDSATDNLGGLAYRIYTTTGKLVATTSSTSWSGTKQRGAVYYVVAVDIAGGTVRRAGIALTGVGSTTVHAVEAGDALVGNALTEATIQQAAELAANAAKPRGDHRGSAAYKRHIINTFTACSCNQTKMIDDHWRFTRQFEIVNIKTTRFHRQWNPYFG